MNFRWVRCGTAVASCAGMSGFVRIVCLSFVFACHAAPPDVDKVSSTTAPIVLNFDYADTDNGDQPWVPGCLQQFADNDDWGAGADCDAFMKMGYFDECISETRLREYRTLEGGNGCSADYLTRVHDCDDLCKKRGYRLGVCLTPEDAKCTPYHPPNWPKPAACACDAACTPTNKWTPTPGVDRKRARFSPVASMPTRKRGCARVCPNSRGSMHASRTEFS